MKRKVDVTLLGHRFTVRTEKDEAYVHGLAAQVTRKIDEIRRQMRNASLQEQALLVALHLADELLEAQERSAAARAEVRRHTEAMIQKLTRALAAPDLEDEDEAHSPLLEEEADAVTVRRA
jgi:cell division protein ZapA (FtsZ GTPase activity inhibitor)